MTGRASQIESLTRRIAALEAERRRLRRAVMSARRFVIPRDKRGKPRSWAVSYESAEKLDRQLARALED